MGNFVYNHCNVRQFIPLDPCTTYRQNCPFSRIHNSILIMFSLVQFCEPNSFFHNKNFAENIRRNILGLALHAVPLESYVIELHKNIWLKLADTVLSLEATFKYHIKVNSFYITS